MIFTKKLAVLEWNNESENNIIKFWEERGFVFEEKSSDVLSGKRGSLLGNICSYNMSKLITEIRINRVNDNELICELRVNTIMQIITSWNKEHWEMELETFNNAINNNSKMEEEWAELMTRSKKNDIKWTMKLVVGVFFVIMLFDTMLQI